MKLITNQSRCFTLDCHIITSPLEKIIYVISVDEEKGISQTANVSKRTSMHTQILSLLHSIQTGIDRVGNLEGI